MEFFNKATTVRLRSHHNKYLVAGDDEESVRRSRNGSSRKAQWTVELVPGNSHLIRLKSCHGRYLTASDEPFVLTGKKVVQENPTSNMDVAILWEPIKEGFYVKLRTKWGGKFLRANGGTPPWRNSVTHDCPNRTATQDWVLWTVDAVDIWDFDANNSGSSDFLSPASSFCSSLSSISNDCIDMETGSPVMASSRSANGFGSEGGMELFQKAKIVRLRSHHEKYLQAEDDEESVTQDRNGQCKEAKWTVELVKGSNVVRFKSCYGKYLTATDEPFLLGVAGKKVLQTIPTRLDSSVEWEPIKEGFQIRFKTRYGNFLRANGGVPPWRNSITHDVPSRSATQDWVMWEVDVVELRELQLPTPSQEESQSVSRSNSAVSEPGSPSLISIKSLKFSRLESSGSFVGSPIKNEGRVINYSVAEDRADVDEAIEEASFNFKGSGVEELKQKLREETGLEDIIVCSRNPLNGKLYALKLHLPPNNATMHVIVVPMSSKAAAEIVTPESPKS